MDGWQRMAGSAALLLVLAAVNLVGAQPACIQDVVCVTPRWGSRSVAFHVEKQSPGPLTVRIEVEGANMTATAALPFVRTYEDTTHSLAFVLLPEEESDRMEFEYSYRVQYGRLGAQHDDTYTYALPYAPGTAYHVVQGYDGPLSHQGRHAIDWMMPVGTPVYAARSGLVVGVVDSLREGGYDEALLEKANYVAVLHDDGTVANYAHLQPGSAEVAVGDTVRRGQMLARSGNTGFSAGPHLHFEVFTVGVDLHPQTVPTRFAAEGAPARGLEPGRMYRTVEE